MPAQGRDGQACMACNHTLTDGYQVVPRLHPYEVMNTIWETRTERQSEDERLADRFTRRESEAQRTRRIAAKRVDQERVAVIRTLLAA